MKKKKNESGQAIVLVALTILVMCLFAFTTINTGVVFYRRIQMQNAADCAALSSARITARSLNTIAQANNVIGITHIYCVGGFMTPIFWGSAIMLKSMKGAYEAMRSLETAWVRAGAGQAALVGRRVAQLNGANLAVPTGGFGMRLRGRRITVYWTKCIRIPTPSGTISIEIPWPPFRTRYDPAYYRRTWAQGERRAQPTHNISWVVRKNAYSPFGKSLFGGSMSSKQTYANARARVFYDCTRNFWANYGGFPRERNAGWMERAFIPQPASFMNPAQFNAYLVPVGVAYFH
ncbi:MAG: pilus assembly protein TadG-related protein [bacterium]